MWALALLFLFFFACPFSYIHAQLEEAAAAAAAAAAESRHDARPINKLTGPDRTGLDTRPSPLLPPPFKNIKR